jgi:hypothetical protein
MATRDTPRVSFWDRAQGLPARLPRATASGLAEIAAGSIATSLGGGHARAPLNPLAPPRSRTSPPLPVGSTAFSPSSLIRMGPETAPLALTPSLSVCILGPNETNYLIIIDLAEEAHAP